MLESMGLELEGLTFEPIYLLQLPGPGSVRREWKKNNVYSCAYLFGSLAPLQQFLRFVNT
jgi:hypothetical protein